MLVVSARTRRAYPANARPASVGTMPVDSRSNSAVPSSRSSLLMCRLITELVTYNRRAAALTDPASYVARKYSAAGSSRGIANSIDEPLS